jgi:hypothetical protein
MQRIWILFALTMTSGCTSWIDWANAIAPLSIGGQASSAPERPEPDFSAPVICERSYRSTELGFGFDPPAEAQGPVLPKQTSHVFEASWTDGGGRTYLVTADDISSSSYTQLIEEVRQSLRGEEGTLLNESDTHLDSGQTARLISATGTAASELAVLKCREQLVFTLRVRYVDERDLHVRAIVDATARSLCVDEPF